MESTSLCSSSYSSFNPFGTSTRKSTWLGRNHNQNRGMIKTLAMRRDHHHHHQADHDHQNFCSGGRLVDENMIVLRKRIHETKMIERNYEPPADWMEWEKRYYTSYDSIICDVLGVLQLQLMNTRPSLALGMLALVTLSVPTSAAFMFFHFMEMAKGVVAAGIHMM